MKKLDGWRSWLVLTGTQSNDAEHSLKHSAHGMTFSFAWDQAIVAISERLKDLDLVIYNKATGNSLSILGMPINEIPFDLRVHNCLRAEGINTIGELLTHNEQNLLRIPNFGKKSLAQVKDWLVTYDLKLGDLPLNMGDQDKEKKKKSPKPGGPSNWWAEQCRRRRMVVYNSWKYDNQDMHELAKEYGVTFQRIGQIIKRAERELKRKNDALPSIESIKADAMNHPPPPWLREDQVNESNPD